MPTFVESSGNVFRDLNIKYPESMQLKSILAIEIRKEIDKRKLSNKEISEVLNVNMDTVRKIVRHESYKFKLERLLKFCHLLKLKIVIDYSKTKVKKGK